jgi:uncharacterized glyoxalase superfamily protein PhnB
MAVVRPPPRSAPGNPGRVQGRSRSGNLIGHDCITGGKMPESQSRSVPTDFIDAISVLPCSDIRATHDFLVEVVGLDSGGLIEHEGRVVHGEVRAADHRFWLHEVSGGLTTPAETGARTGGIVLQVRDVDAHYQHSRAAGATILRQPTDEDYGQREYGLRDLDGHDWYIATPFAPPAS